MIGERMIEFRKKQGYSQQEVADILEVSRQTISNWESNQGAPTIDKAKQLAQLYHVSMDDLVGHNINILTKSRPMSSLLQHVIGKECNIEYGDDEDLLCAHEHLKVIDVQEDWVKVEYQRTKEGSFMKKETVIGFIELSKIRGFRIMKEDVS